MAPLAAVLVIVGIFAALAALVCWAEGLAIFAPRHTASLTGTAQHFCVDTCRLPDGSCPLAARGVARIECPLWAFVGARLPTNLRFEPELAEADRAAA